MYTIKQAASRSGVSVPLLRAWERRYHIVEPARTASGYRLYDDAALERVRTMRRLVDAGVLRREPYKDDVRTRDRYRLTEMGLDLYPVLIALRDWGNRYMEGDCPPVEIRHKGCGGEPTLEMRCSKCGEEVGARDAEATPGPGLKVA
jgi:hypothetical protein